MDRLAPAKHQTKMYVHQKLEKRLCEARGTEPNFLSIKTNFLSIRLCHGPPEPERKDTGGRRSKQLQHPKHLLPQPSPVQQSIHNNPTPQQQSHSTATIRLHSNNPTPQQQSDSTATIRLHSNNQTPQQTSQQQSDSTSDFTSTIRLHSNNQTSQQQSNSTATIQQSDYTATIQLHNNNPTLQQQSNIPTPQQQSDSTATDR